MSFIIERDDRVVIGTSGCFGSDTLIDLTLDQVPDADFAQAKALLEQLGSGEKLENDGVRSSNGYIVQLGNKTDTDKNLCTVFNGRMRATPNVVKQAIAVLKPYMPKP